jgi:hypothetical protein
LAQDPTYLVHHPSLAHFLKENPLARSELEGEEDDVAASAKHKDDLERHPVRRERKREQAAPLQRATSPEADDE